MRCGWLLIAGVLVLPLLPAAALAHAFGGRYDLPLPIGFYLFAAGTAVAVTFLVLTVIGRPRGASEPLEYPLVSHWGFGEMLAGLILPVRILGVAIFLFTLLVAFFGDPSPTRNLATLIVWVVWWVGFALFTAFVGNIWNALNPWSTLFSWTRIETFIAPRPLPRWVGSWPAVLLFLGFAWAEMIGSFGDDPRRLGWLILAFSAVTWLGMALYGRQVWLDRVDPFHRFFGLLGRFAFMGRSVVDPGTLAVVRPPAQGLMGDHPRDFSSVVFIMAVLATVTFDGFSETPLWVALLQWFAENEEIRPLLLAIAGADIDLLNAIKTLALLAAPIIVSGFYVLTCWIAARLAGGLPTAQLIRGFAHTLLPIAIAYHLAHYFSYLALAGQYAIPLISDPFSLGWDIFGTRDYVIDVSVMNAKAVWYLAITSVITGHVISVVLAHYEALRLYPNDDRAIRSQGPITVLMICFTMATLWILAQPVVVSP